jgi:hypothetical protein
MMAAPITVTGGRARTGHVVLFPSRIVGRRGAGTGRQYDVAPGGGFLINMMLDSAGAPITVLTNCQPEAKK